MKQSGMSDERAVMRVRISKQDRLRSQKRQYKTPTAPKIVPTLIRKPFFLLKEKEKKELVEKSLRQLRLKEKKMQYTISRKQALLG